MTEKEKARRRLYTLESKYGITLNDFNTMLTNQGNVCAICKKKQFPEDHSFCVDHDHVSGKVRGLLCHRCNQAIGLLNDKATFAAQYLIANSKRSWDEYFMHLASLTASRSKDRSTKVGAVIVRDKVILSTGYNGFPRGVNDDVEERHQRPLKYSWVCHAEENAILNAARIGVKTKNSDLYVTLYPCTSCTKAIIQSQITKVFYLSSDNPRWTDDFKLSQEMLSEVGIPAIPLVI